VSTGAIAVDMESHVVAAVGAAHGLPVAAMRVVTDPAERTLPADAGDYLGRALVRCDSSHRNGRTPEPTRRAGQTGHRARSDVPHDHDGTRRSVHQLLHRQWIWRSGRQGSKLQWRAAKR